MPTAHPSHVQVSLPVAHRRARSVGRLLVAASAGAAMAAGVIFAASAGTAHAGEPAKGLVNPKLPGRLSDERTLTRWTTALNSAPIRRRPSPEAATIVRLRYYTEDRLPEVYVALEQAVGSDGRIWVRVRIPMRPNGTTGWVPRSALNSWHINRTFLRVSRRDRRAVLYRGARVLWSSSVGVGAPGTPTPAGRFYIRERIRNLGGRAMYGPIAFGTSAYSRLSDWPGGGVIGIHGTNQPWLIPGRVSHGCVRVPNRAVKRLAGLLKIGTPLKITDSSIARNGRPRRHR